MAESPPSHERRTVPAEAPSLRATLRTEALERIRNIVPEDSDAYEHVALAVASFLSRTLDAALSVERELLKNRELSAESEGRLTPEEEALYEQFLTQANALAIILPKLLQQCRIVQYHSRIQEQLTDVFHVIDERESLIVVLEKARATVLSGAMRGNRPLKPSEIQELVPLATTAWIVREKLAPRPNLSDPQQRSLQDLVGKLPDAEAGYKKKTDAIGQEFRDAQKTADAERKKSGSERITQGLPGAELILDTPEISMDVWRRLLTQGGPLEKKRAAQQLRNGLQQFEDDFLRLRAYETFDAEARSALTEHIRKNDGIGRWFDLLALPGMGELKNRVLTTPEEFESIYSEMMEKMKAAFDGIATHADAGAVRTLMTVLKNIEDGKDVDHQNLTELLNAYARLQQQTGALLAAMQRWKVLENSGRVGATNDPNMLDQATRVSGKTLWHHLREAAPYGVFRSRSYRDKDGRIILLTPSTPEALGWEYQLKEGGKAYLTLQAAILTPLLHRMALRVPLLGSRLAGRWYLRFGVPVAYAGVSMLGAKTGAETLSMKQALDAVEHSLQTLEGSMGKLSAARVRPVADDLFSHLLIALQTVEGLAPSAPSQQLALEAHLYTNQLLMALGYPPYHEIGSEAVPAQLYPDMSPEMQEYLTVRSHEREGVSIKTRESLQKLRKAVDGVATDISPIDFVLSKNALPETTEDSGNIVSILQSALRAPEFKTFHYNEQVLLLGRNSVEQKISAFQRAGETYFVSKKLRALSYDAEKKRRGASSERGSALDPLGHVDDTEIRRLLAIPPLQLLTIAMLLEHSEASNEDIAQFWYKEEYPSGFLARFFGGKAAVDQEIQNRFGPQSKRTGLGKKFLHEWVFLREYVAQKRR